MSRIKFGKEKDDWSVPCHDCGVEIGEFHQRGCDVEECPICHNQLISCNCYDKDMAVADD